MRPANLRFAGRFFLPVGRTLNLVGRTLLSDTARCTHRDEADVDDPLLKDAYIRAFRTGVSDLLARTWPARRGSACRLSLLRLQPLDRLPDRKQSKSMARAAVVREEAEGFPARLAEDVRGVLAHLEGDHLVLLAMDD